MVFQIATLAIVLYVTTIVIGKLSVTGDAVMAGTTTVARAGYGNITDYTFSALPIAAIGLIVLAGLGIIGYFGLNMGGRRR